MKQAFLPVAEPLLENPTLCPTGKLVPAFDAWFHRTPGLLPVEQDILILAKSTNEETIHTYRLSQRHVGPYVELHLEHWKYKTFLNMVTRLSYHILPIIASSHSQLSLLANKIQNKPQDYLANIPSIRGQLFDPFNL